jgi:hypothetical protein
MNAIACRLWKLSKMGVIFVYVLGLMLYSVAFVAAITETGDINGDRNINLSDAILALKICTQVTLGSPVMKNADVSGDGKIGTEEVIYVLQMISESSLLRVSAPNGGGS